MKDHDSDIRGYHQFSRAWYAKGLTPGRDPKVVDEVTFGLFAPDGGTSGEMQMTWEILANRPTPRLMVWNDAWHTLYEFRDVLAELAKVDGQEISPAEFCALLDRCGFRDLTREADPKDEAPPIIARIRALYAKAPAEQILSAYLALLAALPEEQLREIYD